MGEFLTKENKRVYDKHINARLRGVLRGTSGRTVALDNSMSAADVNALINALHKYIPYGETVTFQFADGNYNFTAPIQINGFYGGGILNVYGNAADNSLSVAKSVFFDLAGEDCDGISFYGNAVARLNIFYFKVRVDSTNNNRAIYGQRNSGDVSVWYNYALGNNTANGAAIECAANKRAFCFSNYVDFIKYGIAVDNAIIRSNNNDDNPAGTTPLWGLYAAAGVIMKNGTQPAGSTANELTVQGGVIR